jgi:hypothetical protein
MDRPPEHLVEFPKILLKLVFTRQFEDNSGLFSP